MSYNETRDLAFMCKELQKEALAQMEELEKQYKKEMERAEQARVHFKQ